MRYNRIVSCSTLCQDGKKDKEEYHRVLCRSGGDYAKILKPSRATNHALMFPLPSGSLPLKFASPFEVCLSL